MNPADSTSQGILGSLRTLGDGLLATVQDRVALVGLELEEEKLRLIQVVAWIAAAIVTSVMTLAMASVTLVCIFWQSARLAVLLSLTGLYAALLVVVLIWLRRLFARQPRPFAASLTEIEEDRRCIRGEQ